jgi:hypothetical protein
MKSILTRGHRRNHGSGIFDTAVSSFLREPDLALRKPVLTQALQDPQLQRVLATQGWPFSLHVWQQSVTRECDVWHHKEQLRALEGSRFRLLKFAHFECQGCPFRCQGVPIQVQVGASSTPNETTFTSFPGVARVRLP